MTSIETAIEAALDDLRPGLDADGFKLDLHRVEPDGRIVIALQATPEACYDCLVPDELLTGMVEMAVKEHVPDAREIALVKIGFENEVEHDQRR